jgi:hypothetical protein
VRPNNEDANAIELLFYNGYMDEKALVEWRLAVLRLLIQIRDFTGQRVPGERQ